MLNKEEAKEEIFKTLDKFYEEYHLPEMRITDGEWNALFDTIGKYLHENINDYASALNIIIRKALNLALSDEYKSFTMYHIINALDDLYVFNIADEDIKKIKYEIMMKGLYNNSVKDKTLKK